MFMSSPHAAESTAGLIESQHMAIRKTGFSHLVGILIFLEKSRVFGLFYNAERP